MSNTPPASHATFTVLLTIDTYHKLDAAELKAMIERVLRQNQTSSLATVLPGDWVKSPSQAWASSKRGYAMRPIIQAMQTMHAEFAARLAKVMQ